jgi:MOSC domain-containing protein
MRELGPVVRLQIQRSSLKIGVKPDRHYDPAPLLPVERLAVSADGVLGRDGPGESGGWLVDVHHRAHPATKNEDGLHGVSVGFTSHYDLMRDRFGERITPGCAGENIIAQSRGRITLDMLQRGIAVVGADGAERVRLRVLQVAHPCRPFTGWALGGRVEAEVLKTHLQFLDDGTRGYYCVGEGAAVVEIGDRLVAM